MKEAVAEALLRLIAPMRARRHELMQDRDAVLNQVRQMSAQARETARETLKEVRKRVGLPDPP